MTQAIAVRGFVKHHAFTMNDQISWKEHVRLCTSRAGDAKLLPKISQDTGISSDRLHQFLSKGYLGSDTLKKLSDWLMDNGYLEHGASPSKPRGKEIRSILASDLRIIADLAESSASNEMVAQRLRDFVATHAKGYEAEMKRKIQQ
jgi:hypothetical protein